MRLTLHERFWKHVSQTDDCWLWTASSMNTGYGQMFIRKGKVVLAHRFSWELHSGPIPEGFHVGHVCHDRAAAQGLCEGGSTCQHRRCVNPEHLQLQTPQENNLACANVISAQHAARTHCSEGHLLGGDNVTPAKRARGSRECRQCSIDRNRVASRLIGEAARSLGLTRREYRALHGSSVRAAKQILGRK